MSAFVQHLPVRFQDIDGAGIVFYPRFFSYFHATFEDFFLPATGLPYHVWIGEKKIGWPTVHIESDYWSPLKYGQVVEVAMSFPKIGRSSFVTRYEARPKGSSQLSCRCHITVVTTKLDVMQSMETPPEVRAALERHQPE